MEYSYIKRLKERYPAEKIAIWKIIGEEQNPDMGGSHYAPILAYVHGKYGLAVEYALSLKDFVTWGGGGYVELIEVLELNEQSLKDRLQLQEKKKKLEAELNEVKSKLGINS